MFERRDVDGELAAVRDDQAPDAIVLDSDGDFGTLPPSVAENLLPVVDGVDPLDYDESWLPETVPETMYRLASDEFTVGAPGDGGVTWTRQTDPPTVFVKPRLDGSPEAFVDFLVAEAFVEIGLGLPEHCLGFLENDYGELADAVPLSSADTYQLAVALFDAYAGLHSRAVFEAWDGEYSELYDQWVDAGERLQPRLSDLSSDVASGRTGFADAAEFACSAVKHGPEIPAPFDALDADVYREHGSAYAIQWATRTFDALAGSE